MTSGQPRILQGLWLTLFSILYIWLLLHIQNTYQRTDKVINEDALGYYLILPAYFKYNDPQFAFLDTTLRKTETFKNYLPPVVNSIDNNKKVCKYYSGVAMLQTPFYLMAQSTDKENGHGFGLHYQKWILVSVVFFVLLGAFFYFQLFTAYGASHFQSFLLLCFIVFGTNLQTYLTYDPAYSHAYTFFAFACLLYLLHRFKISKRAITVFAIGLILGLITVIRPLNLYVAIIVPVVIGLPYFLSIRKYIGHVSLLIMGGTVFPLIQTFIWHWQTGQFWVYPYGQETLNLKHAQLIEFLFGFDNGWAIYTPSAFLLLFIGLIIGFHRKTIQVTLIGLIGFAGLLYILSSWYYLHYGCTSGCRPITEYYGIMAVLFVYNWNNSLLKHQLKYIILPVLIAAFAYNRVVLYQYYNHIINWCNMDKQRFSMIFMRTHEVYKYSTYPFWDFSQYEIKPYTDSIVVNQTLKIDESVNIKTEKKTESDNRVLVQIRGRARSTLKSAYLRILITKEGQYIEQQTVLLQRKMSIDGQWHEFEFKFPVHTKLAGANFWIKLEAAERGKDGTLWVKDIAFKGLE